MDILGCYGLGGFRYEVCWDFSDRVWRRGFFEGGGEG